MRGTLENRFYYLDNFAAVLHWVDQRYGDLLQDSEREFITHFFALPKAARALLARMAMRKGSLFRSGKLTYGEIGATAPAMQPLVEHGWVDDDPLITLDELFTMRTRPELAASFRDALQARGSAGRTKAEQLASLRGQFPQPQRLGQWRAGGEERIYRLLVADLCDRLRLMFFGNLRQDWTEFVLAELGVYQYEKVDFTVSSRAFQTRHDIDSYLHLHACRERFELAAQTTAPGAPAAGIPLCEGIDDILTAIPASPYENNWLETRRAKLLFQIGRHYERHEEWSLAARWYRASAHPEARARTVRVLERSGGVAEAYQIAMAAGQAPVSEAERQQLARTLPRLARKLNLAPQSGPPIAARPAMKLALDACRLPLSVELRVQEHLSLAEAPVYYVENTLINALFGLLCWDVIFSPLPGAFFHPFQPAPADLHSSDFYARRRHAFAARLSQLDSGAYRHSIVQTYAEKSGVQCAFVAWEAVSSEIIDHALACIPAAHLKKCFERLLLDVTVNRSGLPDLIQFWPREKRYRLIEVKGPGDRLQDNQIRWLDYFLAHGIPVTVCYVQWAGEAP